MNWCNFELNNTIAMMIGFTLLIVIIVKSFKKRKAAALCLLLLILLCLPASMAQVNSQTRVENQQVTTFEPTMYRYGDLAVVPIVFPISLRSFEAIWVNETGNLTAVWQEKIEPVTLRNPITVEIAVFNATKENPIYLFVDSIKYEIAQEGVFYFSFNLTETIHLFTLACKYQIFVRSLVFAKNVRKEQFYISIAEFLREKQKIITMCILSSISGAAVGVQAKKLTKVTNYYFMALFAPFTLIGLYNIINYYVFAVFGLSAMISYYFAREIKETLLAIKVDHEHGRVEESRQIDVAVEDKIYLLEGGFEGLKNAIKQDWMPINILNGDFIDIGEYKILFYEDIYEENGTLNIVCDWAFTEAFKKSEIVKEYSEELHTALTQLLKYETAFDVEVARKLFELLNSLKKGESS